MPTKPGPCKITVIHKQYFAPVARQNRTRILALLAELVLFSLQVNCSTIPIESSGEHFCYLISI